MYRANETVLGYNHSSLLIANPIFGQRSYELSLKMLDIGKEESSAAKCYFSHTILPHYIDDSQPPTKRKPFSTIYSQQFNHTVSDIMRIQETKY